MIAKLKRDKLMTDLMERGEEGRVRWLKLLDDPFALEQELGTLAAVSVSLIRGGMRTMPMWGEWDDYDSCHFHGKACGASAVATFVGKRRPSCVSAI